LTFALNCAEYDLRDEGV